MNDIRLICLDMDGTLLDDDHATIPKRNIDALQEAARRGVAVAIASGRAWSLLQGVHEQLKVTRYGVLSNGAGVLDVAANRWIYRRPMEQQVRRKVISLLLEWEVPFEVYCEGENYIQRERLDLVTEEAVREAVTGGLPCIAECGGFLYLHRTLEGEDGQKYPMAGVLDAEAYRTGKLSRFGYITLTAKKDQLLLPEGFFAVKAAPFSVLSQ